MPDKDGVLRYSTSNPSRKRPDDKYNWQGKPRDPKKIVIPAINVNAYIQKVGVDQNKEVAVPNNLYLVGWFVDTVIPGEKGLSIIDGHVTGRINDGVFKNLIQLNDGDEFTIEYGNGEYNQFRVVEKKSLPKEQSAAVIFSQKPNIENQLNLVTCSGQFDAKTRSYSERLVVVSEKI